MVDFTKHVITSADIDEDIEQMEDDFENLNSELQLNSQCLSDIEPDSNIHDLKETANSLGEVINWIEESYDDLKNYKEFKNQVAEEDWGKGILFIHEKHIKEVLEKDYKRILNTYSNEFPAYFQIDWNKTIEKFKTICEKVYVPREGSMEVYYYEKP